MTTETPQKNCAGGHDPAATAVAVSDDRFLGDLVKVLQPRTGYRAGVDAVLLAAAVPVANAGKMKILDAGAGVGVVGLCLAARLRQADITMLERVPGLAALARQNAARNGWKPRVRIIEGDLTKPAASLVAGGLTLESFDHVVANPPYHVEGRGTLSPDRLKAGSNAMGIDELEHWARFLAAAAKPGGSLSLIHRAQALNDLLAVLSCRFGAITILPLYPRAGSPAKRVIIQGIKGSRAPLSLLPGLTLHEARQEADKNRFTPPAEAILRHGLSLRAAMEAGGKSAGEAGGEAAGNADLDIDETPPGA